MICALDLVWHNNIHPVVTSENIQKILNSQTQLCFYLKATCFGLNIDHHQTEKQKKSFDFNI